MDSQKIDFSNLQLLSQYGVDVQKNLARFSEEILFKVKNKETAEIGSLLNELMLTVKGINIEEIQNPGPLRKIWNRILTEVSLFKGSFDKINDQLDFLITELELSKGQLLQDIQILEKTYEQNLAYYYDLERLITAGEEAIHLKALEIDQAIFEHQDLAAIQRAQDQTSVLKGFEKRIHDLKLTKMMTLQTLPQIRIIQHNNNELINKIQSSILNTIPIWKNQIVLTLSLQKQKQVAEVQKKIHDTTNALLTKNSEILKQNAINVARLGETGIIECQSLQKVNDDLISVISSVLQIYQEGKERREAAEIELGEMERRLKATLANVG